MNKKILSFLLVALLISLLTGCKMQYRVFFNEYTDTQTYQDVKEGEKVTYYEPTKEGFDFMGWYTEDDELFNFETPIKKNMTLYAYYSMKEWTVTFVVDKDDSSKNITQSVKNNHFATEPHNPIKSDYVFLGWVIDGVDFDFDTAITSDITIYANFVKDSEYKPYLTITLVPNNSTEKTQIGVDRLSKISSLPTPEREGYEFVGWFLGDDQITTDTIITEISDFCLYAHYVEKTE